MADKELVEAEDAKFRYLSIDEGIPKLLQRAHAAVVAGVLEKQKTRTRILAGEVIFMRRGDRRSFLRMRGTNNPEVAFDVSIPSTLRPEPELGDMLRIEGVFRAVVTACGVELRFEGNSYGTPQRDVGSRR